MRGFSVAYIFSDKIFFSFLFLFRFFYLSPLAGDKKRGKKKKEESTSLNQLGKRLKNLVGIDRLRQMSVYARLQAVFHVFFKSVGGKGYNGNCFRVGAV